MDRAYIDIYCERTGPEFWSEPLNAVTNLAFIGSGIFLLSLARRVGGAAARDPAGWILIALVYTIGIGSGLFHTFAVRWAMLADVIPITLFILFYTFFALRRFLGLNVFACAIGTAAVPALGAMLPAVTGLRGGSYLAALTMLLIVGSAARLRGDRAAGSSLLVAAAVFAVSLALRTVDGAVCDSFPIGTHFLWHILNAVVLYIVTAALIRFSGSSAGARTASC